MKRHQISISFNAACKADADTVFGEIKGIVKLAEERERIFHVETKRLEEILGEIRLPENVEGEADDPVNLTFDEIFVPDADRF